VLQASANPCDQVCISGIPEESVYPNNLNLKTKTPPYRVTVRGRRRIEPQKQGSRVLAAILGGSNPSQRAVPGSFVLFERLPLRRPWRSEGTIRCSPALGHPWHQRKSRIKSSRMRRVKSFSKDQLEVRFRIVSRARRQISAAAGSSNSRSSFHLSLVHSSR
jgi:hypothetical protein